MRLINARTLKLEEFPNEKTEKYAILSHRWEGGEVSIQDMQNLAVASSMKGYAKIQHSCERAIKDGYDYVWVDTCCINQESSTELSEAINSMYRWYKASAICYVFLSDVTVNAGNDDTVKSQIESSKWFTRGWTLQELLAPQYVVFYDQQWEFLGTKQTMSNILTLRTGIDEAILGGEPPSRRSIAQRMSWASKRVTTRIEDTAYCLLGIFDVNMPMLYGEGEKAFFRLQAEIIKQSDDHTIFAWPIHRHCQPGLLADNPAAFANCQHVTATSSRKGHSPYSLTNRGLSIKLMANQFMVDTYIVRLDCDNELLPAEEGPANEYRLGIFLRRLSEDDQYARVEHEGKTFMRMTGRIQAIWPIETIEINVRQEFTELTTDDSKERINGFRIATTELFKRSTRYFAADWDPHERLVFTSHNPRGLGVACILNSHGYCDFKLISLGFDFECNPLCFIDNTGIDPMLFVKWYQQCISGQMAWSKIINGFAIELKEHPGHWALKGDRIDGLKVRIGNLANLRIVRAKLENKLVWDVHLDKPVVKEDSVSSWKKFFR